MALHGSNSHSEDHNGERGEREPKGVVPRLKLARTRATASPRSTARRHLPRSHSLTAIDSSCGVTGRQVAQHTRELQGPAAGHLVPRPQLLDNGTALFLSRRFGRGSAPLRPSRYRSSRSALWLGFVLAPLLALLGSLTPLAAQALTDFHLQWVWTVGGYDIGLRGFEIVDLDGDGRSEILAAASASESSGYWYTLERQGSALVQTYSTLTFEDGVISVDAAVAGGRTRVVVTGSSSIRVFDGATRLELASFPTWNSFTSAAAAADLDGDGILDLALCDQSNLYVFELLTGTSRVKYGFGCDEVKIGQTDGDPQLEIVLSGNFSGGFVLDSLSLTVDWADVRGFGSHFALGDFDADGRDELASLFQGDEGLRVQDPETGALLWELPTPRVDALAAADLDAEPGAELVYAPGQWNTIYVLDGSTSAELRLITNPSYSIAALTLGDADNDGVVDILWSGYSGDVIYLAPGDATTSEASSPDWRGPFPGLGVGDFSGDGSLEVASATTMSDSYRGGIALVLSLEGGRLLRSATQGFPGPFNHTVSSFTSGQLDADTALEICLGGERTVGCFDGATFAEQWRTDLEYRVWDLRSGELDGDALPELLVGADAQFVYAFDGESGALKWQSPDITTPGNWTLVNRLELANLVGDASSEVVSGSLDGSEHLITTHLGNTGLVLSGPYSLAFTAMTALPGTGPPEMLLVAKEGGTVVAYDPMTGTEGAAVATFPSTVYSFGIVDFNRDGVSDVAAVSGNHVRVHDGSSGLPLWVSPYLDIETYPRVALLVGDLDRDSVAEILVTTVSGIVKFEAPLLAIFADGFESGDTSNW